MSTVEILTTKDLQAFSETLNAKFDELLNTINSKNSKQENEETYLTKNEVSVLLNISLPTINRRMKKGILRAYKLKGDTRTTAVRFKKSEVLEMLNPFSDELSV